MAASIDLPQVEDLLAGRKRHVLFLSIDRLVVDDLGDDQPAGHSSPGAVARLGIAAVGEHDAEVEGLIAADVAGQDHALDGHVGPHVVADGHDVDADARGGQGLGLLQGVALVLVAVGHQHDPPGGIFGKGGLGQLHGGGDVRGLRVEQAFDRVAHLQVVVEGREFDGGLAAEDDHPGAVLVAAMGVDFVLDVLDHRLALCFRDAQRLVQQVDDRQMVVAPHDLQVGRRHRQQRDHERAEQQGQPAPHAAQPGQAAIAVPPEHRQQQEYCQVGGRGKGGVVGEHRSFNPHALYPIVIRIQHVHPPLLVPRHAPGIEEFPFSPSFAAPAAQGAAVAGELLDAMVAVLADI